MFVKYNVNELKDIANQCCNTITFKYKNVWAGIDATAHNSKVTFELWWGDNEQMYNDVHSLFDAKIFDGKSLADVLDDITDLTFN